MKKKQGRLVLVSDYDESIGESFFTMVEYDSLPDHSDYVDANEWLNDVDVFYVNIRRKIYGEDDKVIMICPVEKLKDCLG